MQKIMFCNKFSIIILVQNNMLCIKLVNYWDKYTEMHGQQNVKKINIPYILESNPHHFCSFRGLKNSDAD